MAYDNVQPHDNRKFLFTDFNENHYNKEIIGWVDK